MSALTITQQTPGNTIIAHYSGTDYKYKRTASLEISDTNLPKTIKNLATGDNASVNKFSIAVVKAQSESEAFSFSGEMSLVSNDLVNDGMVVVYDVDNDTVIEHVPVLGDVKLGAGDE